MAFSRDIFTCIQPATMHYVPSRKSHKCSFAIDIVYAWIAALPFPFFCCVTTLPSVCYKEMVRNA